MKYKEMLEEALKLELSNSEYVLGLTNEAIKGILDYINFLESQIDSLINLMADTVDEYILADYFNVTKEEFIKYIKEKIKEKE